MGKRLAVLSTLLLTLALLPAAAFAGDLEPSARPGPTMKTLDQIPPTWSQKLPAAQRFELVLDDAGVLDKETGLVWARSPDSTTRNWEGASIYCTALQLGGRLGWRLPTVEELASLVDRSAAGSPKLPDGHPFQNVKGEFYGEIYWSASTSIYSNDAAFNVGLFYGGVGTGTKNGSYYVWPVRGGQ
jgi:hypothetical protein